MQAVLSALVGTQASVPHLNPLQSRAALHQALNQHLALQWFCQLQVEQLLHQLPSAWVRLVYEHPEPSERHVLLYGEKHWSTIAPDLLSQIESETWWAPMTEKHLKELVHFSAQQVYVYPLSQSKQAEYFLLGTCQPLSAQQKSSIEICAKLLSHHIQTVQMLYSQRKAQQQLEQFIQQIGCRLRHPIALIEGHTESLSSALTEEEPRFHLASVQTSIKEITEHLKQFTEKQERTPQVEYHDLRAILAESLNALEPWIHQKQLKIQQPASSVLLEVDARQLKHVFDIFLANAIQASSQAATIECTWQVFQHEVMIHIWNQGSELSNSDRSASVRKHRRHGSSSSSCFVSEMETELADVQQIIHNHRGNVWLNHQPNGDVKFSFSLPRRFFKA